MKLEAKNGCPCVIGRELIEQGLSVEQNGAVNSKPSAKLVGEVILLCTSGAIVTGSMAQRCPAVLKCPVKKEDIIL